MTVAEKLKAAIQRWSENRGELAEILKAEAEARVGGVEGSYQSTITARRLDGDKAALGHTKESLEYKARIEIDEKWIAFYSLLLTEHIIIDVSDCP